MAKHINVLKRLLGEDKTDETLTALTKATEKLDKAGVTRKQEAGADGGGDGGADTMLAALDSVGATDVAGLVEGILKVVDELGGTEALDTAAGSHAELVAKLIKAVTGSGSSAPEAETAAGDEEDDMPMDGVMMKSAVKSLAGYAVRSIEDMGQLAQAQLKLTEAFEGLTGQVKQLSDLPDRIKAIEDLFSARPRSASKSSTTVVKAAGEGEEDLEKIKKEMGDSVGEQVSVLGLKVSKRRDATYK